MRTIIERVEVVKVNKTSWWSADLIWHLKNGQKALFKDCLIDGIHEKPLFDFTNKSVSISGKIVKFVNSDFNEYEAEIINAN